MKIKELFETEIYIPDTVRDILDDGNGILHNGKLLITDQTGNCDLNVHYKLVQNREIIFPIADVEGDFDCSGFGLVSFKNFPTNIASCLYAGSNNFTSLDGITSIVQSSIDLSGCLHIKSLKNIHLHIKECNYIIIPPQIEDSVLGLLKIKQLEQINIDQSDDYDDDVIRVIEIVNNHLKHKNILACQEELMDNGLKQYAKF